MSTDEQTVTVRDEITLFIAAKTNTTPEPDQDLFASGVATSMFAMQLVVFLEQTFGVAIVGRDLQLANFRTVGTMAELVRRLRDAVAGDDV